MKKIFTAAIGSNGFGIYTDTQKLNTDIPYMGVATFKKFSDFDDAVDYAISTYNYQIITTHREDRFCDLDTLKANWWYFSKDFTKYEKEEPSRGQSSFSFR